jgi:hypothetical protein
MIVAVAVFLNAILYGSAMLLDVSGPFTAGATIVLAIALSNWIFNRTSKQRKGSL